MDYGEEVRYVVWLDWNLRLCFCGGCGFVTVVGVVDILSSIPDAGLQRTKSRARNKFLER
ncbi:hypothetical protein M501DRAFT_1000906 [Patellaria atrata CBS 101060]|uniref:Uncharacterized protein n=1 Tax=Patellaria atrata CBS 101060 TaxID=1346257 RepID=A0A9P4VTM0_9PEZI|nr:hypothetical protein M501DRAFT_1000906 [Patellaria atrata CBS 101060]